MNFIENLRDRIRKYETRRENLRIFFLDTVKGNLREKALNHSIYSINSVNGINSVKPV